jgi:hypothetical protein
VWALHCELPLLQKLEDKTLQIVSDLPPSRNVLEYLPHFISMLWFLLLIISTGKQHYMRSEKMIHSGRQASLIGLGNFVFSDEITVVSFE